ncbi:MAG: helix-turn-helix transcriptional regulator [Clostridiales bacterium]|mgnify:CR=1 FL=1|jgi:DNA-binding transcriptional ArsR family regulator|nr:helix-turn-helix transcriptional regulator [Clostridiales bacterium]HOB64715.1 metalloregulator ArsR/SmtB family transcription factor [Clostridia bacterium]HOK81594.1 metalloregulator ArsR/SmtB family transcription factor [Clostridia bacterium]HOL60491.1 metalloregulator ArsR/SmtB family transcription factor [Clostridia bacterium]HPO52898.1 metalloregulator ArsR/SmtB family transcription factor [Clostridia bacterium]
MGEVFTFTPEESVEALVKKYLPSNAVLADMCNFFSVFSDVTRVKILSALAISELCVTNISQLLDLNQTTVSHQLRLLRDAGLVEYRRDGKTIYYRIANDQINNIMMTGVEYLCAN